MREYKYILILVTIQISSWLSAQQEEDPYTYTYNEHQFHVVGDFNGNNIEDTVRIVHHFDNLDNQLVAITYQKEEELWREYCKMEPQIWISAGQLFNPLVISDSCKASGPQEILYLGDINGDGRDEFALLLWEFNRPAKKLYVYSYQDVSWIVLHELEYYVEGNPKYYPSIDDYFERDENFKPRWFINKDGKRISLNKEE